VQSPQRVAGAPANVGLTHSIGAGLFTQYLLPFEVTSVLLLMAIVGAMSLARRTAILSATARVVPGAQVLPLHTFDPRAIGNPRAVESDTTGEAAQQMGVVIDADEKGQD